MTSTQGRPPMARLHGEAGLLAGVPALLGFHPQCSLVALFLSGPRLRVGPVLRMDLTQADAVDRVVRMAYEQADAVALVAYADSLDQRPACTTLFGAIRWRLGQLHRPLIAELLVCGERACQLPRSPRSEPEWFPTPARDDPGVQTMEELNAFTGRVVLPNRAALAESVAGPRDLREHAAQAALARAAEELAERVSRWFAGDAAGAPGRLTDYGEVLMEAAQRAATETGEVPPDLACSIALTLEDNGVRDAVVAEVLVREDDTLLTALVAAARQVPNLAGGQLCAVLAMGAYRHGEGALAQVAVDRALAADPANRLASMLLSAMSYGLDPALLVKLGREIKSRMAG